MDERLEDFLCETIFKILENSDEISGVANEQRASLLLEVIRLLSQLKHSRKINANLYCFILTGKTFDGYFEEKMPSVEDLSEFCDDPYNALQLLRQIADGNDFSLEDILNHPFHWSIKDKIDFICRAYKEIAAPTATRRTNEKIKMAKKYGIDDYEGKDVLPNGCWINELKLNENEIKNLNTELSVSHILETAIYDLALGRDNKPVYRDGSIYDLMRFFRNNHENLAEKSNMVQKVFGDREIGYWKFYYRRFPKFFSYVFKRMEQVVKYPGRPANLTNGAKEILKKIQDELQDRKLPLNYVRGKRLGLGAHGKVYFAYGGEGTGKNRAVKIVPIPSGGNKPEKEVQKLRDEINLMRRLSHRRIIQYYESDEYSGSLYIYVEYMPGNSVRDEIIKSGTLEEEVACKYTEQIIEGLVYLHGEKILHRDIKCANVLKDASVGPANIKLADFGISKRVQTIKSISGHTSIGTPHWMSPEVVQGKNYGQSADIWSVGITVIEMLTGNPPWHELEGVQAIFKIGSWDTKVLSLIDDIKVSSDCHDFLRTIFVESTRRPSSEEISKDKWLVRQQH